MLTVTEIVGMEVIKKARPQLKEYKFISAKCPNISIPIQVNHELRDNSDIIRFGISDEHKTVVFYITDKYGWSY